MGLESKAESVRSEAISLCFFLCLLDGLLKKKNLIIGKINGRVAVTLESITDWTLGLLAYG